MSKLDELINELCPDGVEWKKLGEITSVLRGKRLTKSNLIQNATYPVFHGGLEPLGYYTEKNRLANTVMIINVGASAGIIGYSDVDFWSSDGCYCLEHSTFFNNRYIYYALLCCEKNVKSKVRYAGIPTLDSVVIENLPIPLPPLPVQREIVRILDSFTKLTAELTAELTEELTARKKQLEHYRKQLIQKEKTVKLSTICDIYLGLTATPNYVDSGIKFISAQNTSSDYLNLENTKYISEADYEKATSNAKPYRGDLLFTRVGSNLGHPVIVDTDEKLCIFVSLGFLRIKDESVVINRYLKHWMNTDLFWEQVRKNVHGAAKVNLNTGWLKDFDIPLPSKIKQIELSDKLDKLDRICTDFSIDLPAEIKTRQQQYEHYRDKLLAFKKFDVGV